MSHRYRNALRTAVLVALSLVANAATFKPSQMVRDINTAPTPVPSYPSLVCDAPGFALLVAEHDYEPYELWRTDGTQSGTLQIAEFPTNSASSTFNCLYAEGPGPVLFEFSDDFGTPQLWRSDGTAAGTFRVLEQAGPATAMRLLGVQGQPLFIAMINEDVGVELVRSDGTVAGTQLLKDFTPGPEWSYFGARSVNLDGQLFFAVNGDLWATDGTAAGTRVVLDLAQAPDSGDMSDLVRMGNQLVFSRVNENGDSEVWASDGTTAGSTLLRTFSIQPGVPVITGLTAVSSTRVVFGVPAASGPVFMPLWRTDGTIAGTQPLLPAQPDLDFNDNKMNLVPGGAVFMGITSANGREPWFTDGTDAGTRLLHDHVPGAGQAGIFDFYPVSGGSLYYSYYPTRELWFTDGTISGTWSVSALNAQFAADYVLVPPVPMGSDFAVWSHPPAASGFGYRRTMWRVSIPNRTITRVQDFTPRDMLAVHPLRAGRMLLSLDTAPYGAEPWISDGTAAGTRLLRNLEPELANGSSDPSLAFNMGGNALFAADDGQGAALWRSDGTSSGTVRLSGGAPVANHLGLPFAQLGSSIIYAGTNAAGLPELWRTDGTAAGTVLVSDMSAIPKTGSRVEGSNPGSCGAGFISAGANVYYGASQGGTGTLLRTDGTTPGTVILGSFPNTTLFAAPTRVCVLAVHSGSVYFEAVDSSNSVQTLWRSNGQVGGSEKVLTAGGATLSAPVNMIEMAGSLYFLTVSQGQWGLWKLAPGDPVARLVVPRTWSTDNSFPWMVAVVGNAVLFRDAEIVNGSSVVFRMHRSDGTPAGTYPLSTTGGSTPLLAQNGIRIGSRYLYAGVGDATGIDLWLTDGTASGTSPIRVPVFGDQTAPRPEFINFNGLTYFAINRETSGTNVREIWRTDGTSAGTERVNQVPLLGWYIGGPHFSAVGHRLLFAGYSDAEGVELWSIENEAPTVQPDTASTTAPNSVSIDVLANDIDPDGALARGSLRIFSAAANGTTAVDSTAGTLRYTPVATFSGTDSIQYVVADTQGRESAPATVTITVAAAPGGGGGSGGGGGGTGGGGASGGGGSGGGGGFTGWPVLLALTSLLAAARRRFIAPRLRGPPPVAGY